MIVLVVFLGWVKRFRHFDLRDDGVFVKSRRTLELGDVFFGLFQLLRGGGEDGGAVLQADVRPLTVELRRIVKLKEILQQLTVADSIGIVVDPNGFGMAGRTGADLGVGGIWDGAALIA